MEINETLFNDDDLQVNRDENEVDPSLQDADGDGSDGSDGDGTDGSDGDATDGADGDGSDSDVSDTDGDGSDNA